MAVNWDLVVKIAGPLLLLLTGAALTHFTERRSKLITYYGHVGTLTVQQRPLHTHVVVIRNVGRKPATNVRVSHQSLPDYNIWPPVQHSVEDVPGSGRDIVIPRLVPGEQITINYIYSPPTTYEQVMRSVKSDEGFAQGQSVLLTRQFPRWFQLILGALLLVGFVAVLYVLVSAGLAVWRRWP
jgi:hypothetical protein